MARADAVETRDGYFAKHKYIMDANKSKKRFVSSARSRPGKPTSFVTKARYSATNQDSAVAHSSRHCTSISLRIEESESSLTEKLRLRHLVQRVYGPFLKSKTMRKQKLPKLRLGTWNVSTLKNKEFELVSEAATCGLHLVGLSSTKRKGTDSFQVNGWQFHCSGVKKQTYAKEGVAFAVPNYFPGVVRCFEPVDARCCVLRTTINDVKLSFVQVYAPNVLSDYVNFLNVLNATTVRLVEGGEKVVVMGDWNAHVGFSSSEWPKVIGKFSSQGQDAKGKLLLDYCVANQFRITNTFFEHREAHRMTWKRSVNGVCDGDAQSSCIDLFLVENDLFAKVTDTRVRRGAELESDHRLVVCSMHFPKASRKLVTVGRPTKAPVVKIERIKTNKLDQAKVRHRFREAMEKRTRNLTVRGNPIDRWNEFKDTLLTVSKTVCGVSGMNGHNSVRKATVWWTEEVQEAVKAKKLAYKQLLTSRSDEAKARYGLTRNTAARAVARAKRETEKSQALALSDAYQRNPSSFWLSLKKLRNRRGTSLEQVKDSEGMLCFGEQNVAKVFADYFSNLYESNPNGDSTERLSEVNSNWTQALTSWDIGPDELDLALKQLRPRAAPGKDGIDGRQLKCLGEEARVHFLGIINDCYESGIAPLEWGESILIPLYKKGDKSLCSNYRAIALTNIPGKVYAKVLLNRALEIAGDKVMEEQCGFRGGRSVIDQTFTLQQIIEKRSEFAMKTFACFVDIKKAYDSLDRELLWKILSEYGISGKLLSAIKSLYDNTTASVRIKNVYSKPFHLEKGVRQGCVLSPFLFSLYFDYVVRKSMNHGGVKIGNEVVKILLYADDLVLLSESEHELQKMVQSLDEHCSQASLEISTEKSEVIVFDRKGRVSCNIKVRNVQLKQVDSFKYLGTVFSEDTYAERNITNRIESALSAFHALNDAVFKKRCVTSGAKLIIFQRVIAPIMSFGCEAAVLRNRDRQRLEVAEMTVLRRVAGLTRVESGSNANVRSQLQVTPYLLGVDKALLRWAGHVFRQESSRLIKRVAEATIKGRRLNGHPKARWSEKVLEVANRIGIYDMKSLKGESVDPKTWRKRIKGLEPKL